MKKVLLGMSALLVSAASFANYGLEVKVGVNGGARFKQSVSIEDFVANYTGTKSAEMNALEDAKSKLAVGTTDPKYNDNRPTPDYDNLKTAEGKLDTAKQGQDQEAITKAAAKVKEEQDNILKPLKREVEFKLKEIPAADKAKDEKYTDKIEGRSYVGSAEVTVYKKLSVSEDFDVKAGAGVEAGIIKMKDQNSKFFVSPYVSGEVSKEVKEDVKVFVGANLGSYNYFGNLKKFNLKAEGFVGASYKDMYNVQLSAGTLKHVSLGVSARLGF